MSSVHYTVVHFTAGRRLLLQVFWSAAPRSPSASSRLRSRSWATVCGPPLRAPSRLCAAAPPCLCRVLWQLAALAATAAAATADGKRVARRQSPWPPPSLLLGLGHSVLDDTHTSTHVIINVTMAACWHAVTASVNLHSAPGCCRRQPSHIFHGHLPGVRGRAHAVRAAGHGGADDADQEGETEYGTNVVHGRCESRFIGLRARPPNCSAPLFCTPPI